MEYVSQNGNNIFTAQFFKLSKYVGTEYSLWNSLSRMHLVYISEAACFTELVGFTVKINAAVFFHK